MSTLRAAVVYSVTSLCSKGGAYIVMPYVLTQLTPAEFGAYTLMLANATLMATLSSGGVRQLYAIHSPSHPTPTILLGELVNYWISWAIPVYALSIIICYLLGQSIATIGIMYLLSVGIHLTEWYHQIAAFQGRIHRITMLTLTGNILTMLSMAIGTYYAPTAHTLCIAQIIGFLPYIVPVYSLVSACQPKAPLDEEESVAACAKMYRNTSTRQKRYARQGATLLGGVLIAWLTTSSTRWLLAYYTTLTNVGLYGLIDMLHTIWRIGWITPFQHSYMPRLLKKITRNEVRDQHSTSEGSTSEGSTSEHSTGEFLEMRKVIRHLCALAISLMLIVVVGWYLIGKTVARYLLPTAYHSVIPLLVWAGLYNILGWLALMLTMCAQAAGAIQAVSVLYAVHLGVHLGVSAILIRYADLAGAVMGSMVSQLFLIGALYSCIYITHLRRIRKNGNIEHIL